MCVKHGIFTTPGSIPLDGGIFSDKSVSVIIGKVECFGNETDIFECSHLTDSHEEVSSCDPNQVAGVVCQGQSVGFKLLIINSFLVHRPYYTIC